jgi:predicted RNase H-like nuclease
MTLGVGVDACGRAGVELHDGRFAAAHFDRELPQLVRSTPDAAAIAVDIPLGLADEDWRDADAAAKKFLGKRSSSVFMTPPKLALAEKTHALGVARCRELTGKGFSIQAWGLKAKLLEANSLYESGDHPISEVHPEVSFAALGLSAGDGQKKSWRGLRARERVLSAVGIVFVASSRTLRIPELTLRMILRSPDLLCESLPGFARSEANTVDL